MLCKRASVRLEKEAPCRQCRRRRPPNASLARGIEGNGYTVSRSPGEDRSIFTLLLITVPLGKGTTFHRGDCNQCTKRSLSSQQRERRTGKIETLIGRYVLQTLKKENKFQGSNANGDISSGCICSLKVNVYSAQKVNLILVIH